MIYSKYLCLNFISIIFVEGPLQDFSQVVALTKSSCRVNLFVKYIYFQRFSIDKFKLNYKKIQIKVTFISLINYFNNCLKEGKERHRAAGSHV